MDIMGPRSWDIQGHVTRHQARLLISFGGIGLLSMENCAPSAIIGSQMLVVPYLCFRFRIFDKPVLE